MQHNNNDRPRADKRGAHAAQTPASHQPRNATAHTPGAQNARGAQDAWQPTSHNSVSKKGAHAAQASTPHQPRNHTSQAASAQDDWGMQDALGAQNTRGTHNNGSTQSTQQPAPHNQPAQTGSQAANEYFPDYITSQPVKKKKKKHRKPAAKKVLLCVLVVALVLLIPLGILGISAKNSADVILGEKGTLVAAAKDYAAGIESGDTAKIESSTNTLQSSLNKINTELDNPAWTILSVMPIAGDEVKNVQTIMDIANNLVNEVADPLGDFFANHPVSSLVSSQGVDAKALEELASELKTAAPTIVQAAADFEALPESHIAQINDLKDKIASPLKMAGALLANNASLLDVLPAMLGADEDRTYLLVAQSYPEVRSEAGFPGQLVVISISEGNIEISASEGLYDICKYAFTSASTTDAAGNTQTGYLFNAGQSAEAMEVFGDTVNWHPGDLTMDPDFTHVGAEYYRLWEGYCGQSVDGVITMDVPFLQMLIETMAQSITLDDGTELDSSAVSDELTHQVYVTYGNDGDAHEVRFNQVMDACIDTFFGNIASCDKAALLETVQQGISEHRLMAWMNRADEQAVMSSFDMDGVVSTDTTTAELGVYYNNKTYGKIDWYLSRKNVIHSSKKNADGSTTYTISTIMTNNCTPEEAATLCEYITGDNYNEKGGMTTDLVLYAPAGGSINNVRMGGTADSFAVSRQTVYGINVVYGRFRLDPQETLQVTYDVTTSSQAQGDLILRQTPMSLQDSMVFESAEGIEAATKTVAIS